MPDTKQVFQWRKEGRLDEAIALARQLFDKTPSDPWVNRAYGWTLHDCLKAAKGPNAAEAMRGLFAEFEKLHIPEDDELLLKSRESWRAKIPTGTNGSSLADLLKEAKQASDAGNRQEALRMYREAIKAYPNVVQASMSLGWEIQRALKDLISQEAIDGQGVQKLLHEYARIEHIERPSNLHALILTRAAQAATKDKLPNFIRFFKWWDPAHLQPGDFEKFTPEGGDKSFPSRVEVAIRAIHKASNTEADKDNIAWAAAFVGQHYEKFPEQEWFPYYYGQLLVKTGDLTHARQVIIPIVLHKKKDFWSWHTLAGTFDAKEADKTLACLCMSLLCHTHEDKFLVNVHEELGALLAAKGIHEAAKYEVERAIAIREAQKPKAWNIPPRLKELQSAAWNAKTTASKSNKAFYEQHAPTAEALILEGLPQYKAILMHQLPPSDDKPGVSFVLYQDSGKTAEARVKTKHFDCLAGAKIGSPFIVQIDNSAGHAMVVALRHRAGTLWDLLPDRIGVVRQVNLDKGLTVVILGKDEFCLFHHDKFPDAAALKSGDIVAVKCRRDTTHDKTIALAFAASEAEPPAEIYRRFHGTLEQNPGKQFGFVNHEFFVSPDLIDGTTIAGGISVQGGAVLDFDQVKKKYGWRAVTIERAKEQ